MKQCAQFPKLYHHRFASQEHVVMFDTIARLSSCNKSVLLWVSGK